MPVSKVTADTPFQGTSAAEQPTNGNVQAWQAAATPPPAPPPTPQAPESLVSDNPSQDPTNCLSTAAATAKNGQDNIVFLADNSSSAGGIGHVVVQDKATGQVTDPESLTGQPTSASLSTYINQAKANGHDFTVAATASAGDVQQVLGLPRNQRSSWITRNAPQMSSIATSLFADTSTPPAAWNQPSKNPPARDPNYSNTPRWIGIGQYGNGIAEDFAASYGGLAGNQRAAFVADPSTLQKQSLPGPGPVDPNQVIAPATGYNETAQVDGSTAGEVGADAYLAGSLTFSGQAAIGTLNSYGPKAAQMGEAAKGLFNSAAGNLGSTLYLAGSFANLFATHSVYVGAAVNNAEDALGFSQNVALFGANAEGGQHIMDNQTKAMNEATDKLSTDSNGNFKDPEYAMRTVNQLMKLSGQAPAFTQANGNWLPEVTTAGSETDIPLPADLFGIGGGSSRTDEQSAISNQPDTASNDLGTIKNSFQLDGQDAKNVSQDWMNRANTYVNATAYTNATSRQTGMTRMVNDYDGQLQATGNSLSNWNTASDKLDKAIKNLMDPGKFDKLADQAGTAITNNYAEEEGVDPSNVQPVKIGVNTQGSFTDGNKKAGDLATGVKTAFNFGESLISNADSQMGQTYDTSVDAPLGQAQQLLHANLIGSASEVSPFKDISQVIQKDVLTKFDQMNPLNNPEQNRAQARTDFINDFKGLSSVFPSLDPTKGGGGTDQIMNNMFKTGLYVSLGFNAHNRQGAGAAGTSTDHKNASTDTFKLQVDNAHDNPGQLFDQIWDAVSHTVSKNFSSNYKPAWVFDNAALNGEIPIYGVQGGVGAAPTDPTLVDPAPDSFIQPYKWDSVTPPYTGNPTGPS